MWDKRIQTPMLQGRPTMIISMMKWIRTSRLSIKKYLSAGCLMLRPPEPKTSVFQKKQRGEGRRAQRSESHDFVQPADFVHQICFSRFGSADLSQRIWFGRFSSADLVQQVWSSSASSRKIASRGGPPDWCAPILLSLSFLSVSCSLALSLTQSFSLSHTLSLFLSLSISLSLPTARLVFGVQS